jgi:O-antigen/teichoic acid export membrane protein
MFGRSLLYVVIGSFQLLVTSLVSPVLVHLLDAGEFGSISLALAVYQLLYVLAVFGFDQVLVIYHAQAGGPRQARRLLLSASLFGFVVCGIFLASEPWWSSFVGAGKSSGVVALAVLWVGPSATNALVLSLLRADDRFGRFAVLSMISAVGGQLAGVTVLLLVDRDPVLYAAACAATHFFGLVVGLVLIRPREAWPPMGGRETWSAFRVSAPIALSALAYYVLNTSDRIVVARDLGEVAVGQYQVAYIVGSSILIVLNTLNSAWLPLVLSIRSATDRKTVSDRSRDQLLWVLVPLVTALIVVTPTLLRIVAPASIGRSSLPAVVAVVALSAFPVAHASASARYLISVGRRAPVGWWTAAAAVLNIVLNVLLVPRHGIFGSGVATLVAFAAQALGLAWAVGDGRRAFRPAITLAAVLTGLFSIVVVRVPAGETWRDWQVIRLAVGAALGILSVLLLRRARRRMVAATRAARHRARPSQPRHQAPRPVPKHARPNRPYEPPTREEAVRP